MQVLPCDSSMTPVYAVHHLQELPETLCGLQLVLLDLTNNSLRRLPPALGQMTSLRSMPLDGNALKLMRRELWSGRRVSYHSFLRCSACAAAVFCKQLRQL
jgi:Leucine-rich repeat (LRR) protein